MLKNPTYCTLYVEHSNPEKLTEFFDDNKTKWGQPDSCGEYHDLDFNRLMPVPDKDPENPDDSEYEWGEKEISNWKHHNWGTHG